MITVNQKKPARTTARANLSYPEEELAFQEMKNKKLGNLYEFTSENQKIKGKPVIVTRRNISTAHRKQKQQDEDDDNLLVVSTCFTRKKNICSNFQNKDEGLSTVSRPQSKQEPKRKVWNEEKANQLSNSRRAITQNDRPETSRGRRQKAQNSNQADSKANDSKQGMKSSTHMSKKQTDSFEASSKPNSSTRIIFKNSIDSEFLSLFAN